MNLFFDLDGTLFDSRARLYRLFQSLVIDSSLSFEEYWTIKRRGFSHSEILRERFSYSNEDYREFEKLWMEKIEATEWLALDQPFVGVKEFLFDLKSNHQLFVVTARQFEHMAIDQINNVGWGNIFKEILVTSQQKEKYELIRDVIIPKKEDWFIGDTGKDIQTGKQLKINTAAVLSGFLSGEKLKEYLPDIIAERVIDLKF